MYSAIPGLFQNCFRIVPKKCALYFHTLAEINLSDPCDFTLNITIFIGLIMENISLTVPSCVSNAPRKSVAHYFSAE